MRLTSRSIAALAAGVLSCIAGPGAAQEQYPARPITLVVPFSAGSQPDILARSIGDGLSKLSGQAVVVMNREGAAGTIAVESVAKAKPDGYTLGFGPPGQFLIQPHIRRNLGYRIDQFEFVCQTHLTSFVLATSANSPFTSLKQLLDAARTAPGKLNMGSSGHLIVPHLLAESMAAAAGVKFTHVPFKSVGDLYVQGQNGSVDFIATTPIALTAGRGMRGLIVMGDSRLPAFPDVPTLGDAGFTSANIKGLAALGMYAPKGLPPQHVSYLQAACAKIAQTEPVRAVGEKIATPVAYADGPTYSALLIAAYGDQGALINALGGHP